MNPRVAPELFESSFARLLARAADEFGDAAAIRHRGADTSFRHLGARAAGIADALRALGIQQGDRCAILAGDPTDAAAAFFGALAAGAIGVIVNELARPRQIEYVLRQCDARIVLTTARTLRQLPRPLETTARLLDVDRLGPGDQLDVQPCDPGSPAQIVYTSASTGLPKGVVTSHRALWAGVRIVASYLGLRRDDRIAGLLPFSFVYGFNQLTTALFSGATLVAERSPLAAEIVAALRRERVSVLAAVPPLWAQLLGVPAFVAEPLPSLRIMTCAGGKLPPASVQTLRRAQPHAQLVLMYGLTEVFRSTYLPADRVDAHPDSMGRAIPESTVYVVRDDGSLAAPGEVGELAHGGPTTALGYWNDAEATARAFRRNPFAVADAEPRIIVYSGDLVRRDAEGLLYYVGRRDRMIKTLGFRVSPDEICDVIQASGDVRDAAVVSTPDPVRGEAIVACVVLREPDALERLVRFCRVELPRHMQPVRYVVRDAIPRTASGKHDIITLTNEVRGDASGAARVAVPV